MHRAILQYNMRMEGRKEDAYKEGRKLGYLIKISLVAKVICV